MSPTPTAGAGTTPNPRKTEASQKLDELAKQEASIREELGKVQAFLGNVATPEEIKAKAEEVASAFQRHPFTDLVCHWARTWDINARLEIMTWEEKRALCEMVFSGKTPEGKRMGIYVEWVEGQEARRRKRWWYRITGHLIEQGGFAPKPPFVESELPEDSGRLAERPPGRLAAIINELARTH